MDNEVTTVVGFVEAAGGTLVYPEILAQYPPEKRGQLPKVLSEARARGLLRQDVQLVDGKIVHTYYKVG